MKKEKTGGFRALVKQLDLTCMLLPLAIVTALCILFMCNPEGSTRVIDAIRGFLGNQLGFFYIILGFGLVIVTLYMGLSKYGSIRLGNLEKPEYSNFQWGTMIFTGVFAADIIYYSFIEWALYAGEKRISDLGSVQDWASTYPLFHWGPIPWAIYIVLAVSFGFMIHVRGRNRQKFSEACRPLLGSRVDGAVGKIIDLIAILALLAGTATTFSVTTPLLSAALCHVFGFTAGPWLTVAILVLIAILYTVATLKGIKGVSKSATICTWLFFVMLAIFLLCGGQTVYIIETGVTAIGNLFQNFIGMATWMDPLRTSGDGTTGFVQNWTIFYWAYWMAWCVATPFFIGMISKGRTIKNVVFGTYCFGLSGTFLSFIIFGDYGLSQQMLGKVDIIGIVANGRDLYDGIVQIFETMPLTNVLLVLLFAMMCMFYSTTFDCLTLVTSQYSYKKLAPDAQTNKGVRAFWCVIFIIFPIGLIFAENSMYNLQSVSIIAAFPIGIIIILILISFFKDAKKYLAGDKS